MAELLYLRQQRGFTLVELPIFIVVVSAGSAGILSVMDNTIQASTDPMVCKQRIAVVESLLEEIVLKDYCEPDTDNRATKLQLSAVNRTVRFDSK